MVGQRDEEGAVFLGSAFVYHVIMSNTPGNTLGVLLNTTGLSEQQRRKKSASRLLHIPLAFFSLQPNFQEGVALCAVPTSSFTFHSQLVAIHLVSLAPTPRNCSHQATNVFVFSKSNELIFVLMSCDPPPPCSIQLCWSLPYLENLSSHPCWSPCWVTISPSPCARVYTLERRLHFYGL